jgi:hypothetical protein
MSVNATHKTKKYFIKINVSGRLFRMLVKARKRLRFRRLINRELDLLLG